MGKVQLNAKHPVPSISPLFTALFFSFSACATFLPFTIYPNHLYLSHTLLKSSKLRFYFPFSTEWPEYISRELIGLLIYTNNSTFIWPSARMFWLFNNSLFWLCNNTFHNKNLAGLLNLSLDISATDDKSHNSKCQSSFIILLVCMVIHHLFKNIFIGAWFSVDNVILLVVSFSGLCHSKRQERCGPVPET